MNASIKGWLLLTQEFPAIPIKPLEWFTPEPRHESFKLDSATGEIVADLFIPKQQPTPFPAVIFAMGVKTSPKDKPRMLGFAEAMSRLGFVVLWPRYHLLEEGHSLPEPPETFVRAFQHLQGLENVDAARISFLGFSVGSSIALAASADPRIADAVHALVFFGGYYDLPSYIVSLVTKRVESDGVSTSWQPAEGATTHLTDILESVGASRILPALAEAAQPDVDYLLSLLTEDERAKLLQADPASLIGRLKAPVFILHDLGDSYVPYAQAIALDRALPATQVKALVLADIFEHVQPRRPLSLRVLRELLKLHSFVASALHYLAEPSALRTHR